jgi:putative ABC transport system permease protein
MSILRQVWIVSALNFRNLGQRLWQSLVIVAGMACVIGVLLSMLSMTEGMHQAYLNSGNPHVALVVSRGAQTEGASSIPRDHARIIMDAPGIARAPDGSPIADPGLAVNVPALLRKNDSKSSINLRGFGAKGMMLRPEFHLVAGRMFRPGSHELIVGARAIYRLRGMGVGDKVILPDGAWPIVGSFTTGDLLDGELVGDTETVMLSVRRKAYNSVRVWLPSPESFPTLRRALTTNPALSVDVMRLRDWNRKRSSGFSTFFNIIVYGVGVILAIGALFGCFNTMYAAVGSRSREIATLRALGYGGFPVAASVILEAAALSATGALIGTAFAWARYDGVQTSFGPDVFKMTVSPEMIGVALLWALAVALLGGFFPAFRAARRPVADALRAT